MLRLKNRSNVPVTPKSYQFQNGRRIPWDSIRETWEDFIKKVMAYADANSLERPSIPVIEDAICQRLPGWACVPEEQYNQFVSRSAQATQKATEQQAATAPKKKCCGRK